jgi:hypothetical protein
MWGCVKTLLSSNPEQEYLLRYAFSNTYSHGKKFRRWGEHFGFQSLWQGFVQFLCLGLLRAVFLNRRAAARYRALASIIPGREKFSWKLSFYFYKHFSRINIL